MDKFIFPFWVFKKKQFHSALEIYTDPGDNSSRTVLILKESRIYLTDSSDTEKEASVAEVILRGLVLLGTFEGCQLFPNGATIG